MPTNQPAQSAASHTRWDPLFHYVLMPIFLGNVVVTSVWYAHHRYQHHLSGPWAILMSIALLVGLEKTRSYALKNQDRIIRLEEKLRLASTLTASELLEVESLTVKQYVALRFASNAELPDLARRAVRENLEPKAIKAAIKSWRPDHHRI